MRIIGGSHKGLTLASLGKGDMAAHLRPTSDRVRESLFNLLEHGAAGNPVPEARVLDLFAGTGALGLEALSRGASHVTFVDDGAKSRALIRENIARMQAQGATKLLRRDATKLGERQGPEFDLVFLDPPYGKGLGERALAAAQDGGWLAEGSVVVWEESSEQAAPQGFEKLDARRYGDTWVAVMRM